MAVSFFLHGEGRGNGATQTTYLDGTARGTVRAGWTVRARCRDFLRHWRTVGAQIPAENLSAGGFGPGKRRAGARGRRGSRKRGIDPALAAHGGEGAGEEQEHRGRDARRPALAARYS